MLTNNNEKLPQISSDAQSSELCFYEMIVEGEKRSPPNVIIINDDENQLLMNNIISGTDYAIDKNDESGMDGWNIIRN